MYEMPVPTFLHCPCSYLIEKGVCYLVLCEGSFPKKLAFAYLEDLQAEFHEQHGKRVPTVSRPYSFIEFGEKMRELKATQLLLSGLKSIHHTHVKPIGFLTY